MTDNEQGRRPPGPPPSSFSSAPGPDRLPSEAREAPATEVVAVESAVDGGAVVSQCGSNQALIGSETAAFRLGRFVSKRSDTRLFYVTDLHLDHQMRAAGIRTVDATIDFVDDVVHQLVDSALHSMSGRDFVSHVSDVILIGGDVADNPALVSVFYSTLAHVWEGTIVGVLGNHELWSFDAQFDGDLDETIADYCTSFASDTHDLFQSGRFLLENDLLVFDGCCPVLYREADVLSMSDDVLSDVLSRSSFAILGGMGWAGRNSMFNADAGIYRNAVTRIYEVSRSERFLSIYNRVLSAGHDQEVVVLTHMPVRDWLGVDTFNQGWVYVNGHTHHNGLLVDDDRIVLFDNQIGYNASRYFLHLFTLQGSADPFVGLDDGQHIVAEADYVLFLRSRGIAIKGCSWPGQIILLKRDGVHMFFLQGKRRISLLRGGRRMHVDRDLDYYWDNMQLYASTLRDVFMPYRILLEQLSREIKAFGGDGRVHGSIVDIDYFHHVSVDVFSGDVMVYHAYDIFSRTVLEDVRAAIVRAMPRNPYRYIEGVEVPIVGAELVAMQQPYVNALAVYDSGIDKGLFPLLSHIATKSNVGGFVDVGDESRRALYEPSGIMLGIQRLLDVGVIQVWNDQVLSSGVKRLPMMLEDLKAKGIDS